MTCGGKSPELGTEERLCGLSVETAAMAIRFLRAHVRLPGSAMVDPDDIVQDTLVSALESAKDFHGENQDALFQWFLGILVNQMQSTLRSLRRKQHAINSPPARQRTLDLDELPAHGTPLECAVELSESAERLAQAIDRHLTPTQAALVQLLFYEAMPMDQIATSAHVRVRTIYKRIAQVLAILGFHLARDPYFADEWGRPGPGQERFCSLVGAHAMEMSSAHAIVAYIQSL